MTYQTNFHKGKTGNALRVGENLTIQRKGENCEYIIGRLFKIDTNGKPQMIQIEQTGTKQNPQTNSITFELKQRENGKTISMPPGKYLVTSYTYLMDRGGSRFEDYFEIE